MIKAVNFYRNEDTDEIITLCKACANKETAKGENLTIIDRAADWDICGNCEAQNVPSWYTNQPTWKTAM